MAVIGYALQRGLLNRTLGDDLLPPLLVTFGLSIIIQNGLLELFTADSRKLQAGAIEVAELSRSAGRLGRRAAADAIRRRRRGHRAACSCCSTAPRSAARSAPPPTIQSVAQLMGLDKRHVFALAMALSLAIVAIAGVLLAVRANFDPAIGPARLIFGFEAVIIGGLGSMWGTLAGGIILGVAQAIGAQIDPGWQLLAGHLAFLVDPGGAAAGPVSEGVGMSRSSTSTPLQPHRRRACSPWRSLCWRSRPLGRDRQTCGCSPRSSPIVALASLWNLLAGYAGLVSVGQQAFVGLGGYLLFALTMLAGRASARGRSRSPGLIAAIVAVPVAALMFRLRGHYFAIGTWVVAEVFRLLASQISALGGGSGTSLPAAA